MKWPQSLVSILGAGYGPLRSKPKSYRVIHRLNRSQNSGGFNIKSYDAARKYAIKRGFKVQHQVVR